MYVNLSIPASRKVNLNCRQLIRFCPKYYLGKNITKNTSYA